MGRSADMTSDGSTRRFQPAAVVRACLLLIIIAMGMFDVSSAQVTLNFGQTYTYGCGQSVNFIAPNVGARTIVNFQISGARGGGATGGSGRTVGGTFSIPVSEGLSLLGAGVPLGHVRIVEAAAGGKRHQTGQYEHRYRWRRRRFRR